MNDRARLPLFGYGTFRDERWRVQLLGASYGCEDAVLEGYRRIAVGSGYLSIEPSAHDRVEGVLIELDDVGWTVADAWEDVPAYRRARVNVRTARGLIGACAYISTANGRAEPVAGDALHASLARADVERAIEAFAPLRDRLRRGDSDDGEE